MENFRPIKSFYYFFIGGTLLAFPFFISAYDDATTHRALTQEIVKFFNIHYPQSVISSEDAELMIQGSKDEDVFGRWMRH